MEKADPKNYWLQKERSETRKVSREWFRGKRPARSKTMLFVEARRGALPESVFNVTVFAATPPEVCKNFLAGLCGHHQNGIRHLKRPTHTVSPGYAIRCVDE